MKKFSLAVLLFGSIALLSHPALAQKKPVKAAAKTTTTRNFVRKDLGIALNKPAGWTVVTKNLLPNTRVCWMKQKEGGYQPLIVISAKEIPGLENAPGNGAILPPNFEDLINKMNKESFAEYAFVASSRFKLAGKEVISAAFTTRAPGEQAETQKLVDVRRIYLIHNGQLLMFELDAEVEDYDLLTPTFEKMMGTLKFLP